MGAGAQYVARIVSPPSNCYTHTRVSCHTSVNTLAHTLNIGSQGVDDMFKLVLCDGKTGQILEWSEETYETREEAESYAQNFREHNDHLDEFIAVKPCNA